MTLKALKEKATASELTLIDAVENALRTEIRNGILDQAGKFITSHKLPCLGDPRFEENLRNYGKQFTEYLSTPQA